MNALDGDCFMCGLAALFGSFSLERTRESVERMLQVQTHRGPDSTGTWCGTIGEVNIGLGLRRLKILDLSDTANQPMISQDERFVLVFNGEIYNYVELRQELTDYGVAFRSRGDTEVLLQALIVWGAIALSRLNGMWAFVLVDRRSGEIMLSRDRFGVKPLYVYTEGSALFASSEIKAILGVAGRRFPVNASVANAYLHQGLMCTSSASFFSGVEEFPAAHLAILRVQDIGKKRMDPKPYWKVPSEFSNNSTEHDLIEAVRDTFIESVKIRLRSDVPVGVLLSGGIDSSAIAAAVHHVEPSRDDIKLISAVADNGQSDEHSFIDMMANHLKRPVEKVILNYPPSTALDTMSELSWFNDEPIGLSFSTIARYLLMKRANELGIPVLLSGQGADEILCGYKKYLGFYLQQLIVSGQWLTAARVAANFMRRKTVFSQVDYREAKRYLPRWLRLSEIDVRGPALITANEPMDVGLNGGLIARQVLDVEVFSLPALVHHEDRASMAQAREVRLPFLDYRLLGLLVPLPTELKLRDGWTKWIFRQAMEPLLPKAIAWRRDKQNFLVPQHEWFRSELRCETLKLLQSDWVSERLGLVDRAKFRLRYEAYLRQSSVGGRVGIKDIFAPVALELWARRFEPYLSA